MTDLEKDALKVFAKEIVDVILPKVVAAEEAKLPATYQALAKAVTDALLPALEAELDAKINAL